MNYPVYSFSHYDKYGNGEFNTTTLQFTADTWQYVIDRFYEFLMSQGFYVTELDLAEYFLEKAEEVGNLRANFKEEEFEDE